MTDPNSPNTDLSPSSGSAVSWGAIVAGAVGAAALSLILLMLGVGLGLSSVSPWMRTGMDGTVMGQSSIAWVIVTQLLASAVGGYLAGRLRAQWVDAHTDEVYFRDTAHGFLAWALASLATAALLSSMIASILGSGLQAAASGASGTYARLQSHLTQTQTSLKEAAERARRAGAHASLWLFISLLCGAFVASLSATFGGRLRDT